MRGHFYFQNQESCILFLGTLTHHTLRSEGCDPGHLPGPGMGFSAYCKGPPELLKYDKDWVFLFWAELSRRLLVTSPLPVTWSLDRARTSPKLVLDRTSLLGGL